jgi:hypothetical protein
VLLGATSRMLSFIDKLSIINRYRWSITINQSKPYRLIDNQPDFCSLATLESSRKANRGLILTAGTGMFIITDEFEREDPLEKFAQEKRVCRGRCEEEVCQQNDAPCDSKYIHGDVRQSRKTTQTK